MSACNTAVPEARTEKRLTEIWETPKTVYGWFSTVDHKEIGHRYLATAFIFLIIGGVEALIMRIQLARSDQSWLTPEAYNQLFTMHGITMIFWYASPILSGFANYLIPLMIGARDMAFPRLNAFSYWTFVLSGILLYISAFLGQSPHGGWFAYAPYIAGHMVGLGAGLFSLWLLAAWNAPKVASTGFVTSPRLWAAVLSVVITTAATLSLKASQPASLSTTLLVSLGSMQTMRDAATIAIAVLIIAAVGEPLRRQFALARLRGQTPQARI